MDVRRWSGYLMLTLALASGCGGDAAPAEPEVPAGPRMCNGSELNCQRRYDQVTFAATHNAFSYAMGGPIGYLFPNQDLPISEQLARGIRGLGIRPCPYYGTDASEMGRVYVTHNFSLMGRLGSEPLVDILSEVRTFLEQNPTEIVTLFAESAVTPAQIAAVFDESGLTPYLYTHDAQRGWPTLNEMLDAKTRLVVFNDSKAADRPRWQHYLWDLIVDTDYNITDKSQFSCGFYRGKAENPLYFINNFVYLDAGGGLLLPDQGLSRQANEPGFIVSRAEGCWKEMRRIPNYIYVDWFGQGDVVQAVKTLNALPR